MGNTTRYDYAKLAAFRDMSETITMHNIEIHGTLMECGGAQIFHYEEAICHMVGIPKPDFRKLINGGHHVRRGDKTPCCDETEMEKGATMILQ